jgi:CBS domain-containing protein
VKNLTVSDVMTRRVITARGSTPVKELTRLMVEHRISALPVLDDDDRLIGVVSAADVVLKQGHQVPRRPHWWEPPEQRAGVRRAAGDTAGRLMTTVPVSISEQASLPQAARLMSDRGAKRLPVLDTDDRVVGVVSRIDLLRAFVRSDDDIQADVLDEVFVHLLWPDPTEVRIEVRDGVVELTGSVDRRSTAEAAERLVRRLDGVVDVISRLDHRVDDGGLAKRR